MTVGSAECVVLRKDVYEAANRWIMVRGRRKKWTGWHRKPQTCWPEMVLTNRTTHEPQARRGNAF